MKFDIITIFPKIFDSYFSESILGRAQERKLITVKTYNLRDFAEGKHKKVDDRPFGGGAGMVFMAEPILKTVESITKKAPKKEQRKVVILSAKGKQFNQKMAYDWAKKYERIIFISGRYEGIDERVKTALHAEEISIGPYVLTDGDVAVMAIVSAVVRLLPGVIRLESLAEESFSWFSAKGGSASGGEYPHYTRPEVLTWKKKKYRIPSILRSGDHKKIEEWRKGKTVDRQP